MSKSEITTEIATLIDRVCEGVEEPELLPMQRQLVDKLCDGRSKWPFQERLGVARRMAADPKVSETLRAAAAIAETRLLAEAKAETDGRAQKEALVYDGEMPRVAGMEPAPVVNLTPAPKRTRKARAVLDAEVTAAQAEKDKLTSEVEALRARLAELEGKVPAPRVVKPNTQAHTVAVAKPDPSRPCGVCGQPLSLGDHPRRKNHPACSQAKQESFLAKRREWAERKRAGKGEVKASPQAQGDGTIRVHPRTGAAVICKCGCGQPVPAGGKWVAFVDGTHKRAWKAGLPAIHPVAQGDGKRSRKPERKDPYATRVGIDNLAVPEQEPAGEVSGPDPVLAGFAKRLGIDLAQALQLARDMGFLPSPSKAR